MTEDDINARLYTSWSDPTNHHSLRHHWADIAQDGEHLAGPFATEAEAVTALLEAVPC